MFRGTNNFLCVETRPECGELLVDHSVDGPQRATNYATGVLCSQGQPADLAFENRRIVRVGRHGM